MGKINNSWYTSSTDLWATPKKTFEELDAEFHFTLDPCAIEENAKCKKFYTPEQDGLAQDWGGANCVCEPAILTDEALGKEVYGREQKTEYKGSHAYSGKNGHGILPRLYLSVCGA